MAGQGDGFLLARFAAGRPGAQEAFEVLVRRHGAMVLQTCRGVLKHRHAAEDSFQAAFLVLARQAGALRLGERDSLGPWLHQVATRCALKARTASHRRTMRERRVAELATSRESYEYDPIGEDFGILHEEVERLPEKYRAPVVLCYFKGMTHDEAAGSLNWPVGTVRGRLARARDRLRVRLIRRGLAPGVAAVLAAGESASAGVAVPPLLVDTAVRSASGVPAAASVAVLAGATLRGILAARVRRSTILLILALTTGGAGAIAARGLAKSAVGSPPGLSSRPAGQPMPSKHGASRADIHGDPLPSGAAARMGSLRFNHGSLVSSVAFSPDGLALASLGGRGIVRLWDPGNGSELREFRQFASTDSFTSCFAFVPGGRTMVLGISGSEGKIALLNAQSGEVLRRSDPFKGNVWSIAISPDGATIAASDANTGEMMLYDLRTLKTRRSIKAHRLGTWAVAFTPDGKTVATGGSDMASQTVGETPEEGSVALFDIGSGKEIKRFPVKDAYVVGLAISPDGKRLAAGQSDGTLRLLQLATGRDVFQAALPTQVKCLKFAPDGRILAVGGEGTIEIERAGNRRVVARRADENFETLSQVQLWDVELGREIRSIPAHVQWVSDLAFAPDGKSLATCGAETVIRLWDPSTGEEQYPSTAPRGAIRSLAFAPDRHGLVTGGYDGSIREWHTSTGRPRGRIGACSSCVQDLTYTPDGKGLITGSFDMTCRLWDVVVGREIRRYDVLQGWINHVAISPDGLFLVAGMKRFDVTTGQSDVIYRDPAGKEFPTANYIPALFTGEGLEVIARVSEGVLMWDAASGRLRGTVANPPQGSFAIALSPDSRILATGGETPSGSRGPKKDFSVRLWEMASGSEVGRLEGLVNATTTLVFLPDGRRLASGGGIFSVESADNAVHLWDLVAGRELRRFDGHRNQINKVAISPDGRWLASASEDATVLVWDLARVGVPDLAWPPKGDLDRLWAELAGEDAARAYRAIWSLAAIPDSTVPFLGERLRPVERAGPEEQEWPLRPGQVLTHLRAVAVLEKIANPGARELLGRLASGAEDSRITREARTTLKRLDQLEQR